jgi:hypothetical protein
MFNSSSWAYLTAGKIAVTATSSSSGVPSTSQDSDITDTKGSSVAVGVPVAVTGNVNITGNYQVNGTPISATSNWNQSGSTINYTAGNVGIGSITPGQILDVQGTARMTGSVIASQGLAGLVLSAFNSGTLSVSTTTQRTFDTVNIDSGGYWSSSTYTPKVPGWYLVNYSDNLTTEGNNSTDGIAIYKNGSSYIQSVNTSGSGTRPLVPNSITALIKMNGSTDFLQFYVIVTGGNTNVWGGTGYNSISIVRVG